MLRFFKSSAISGITSSSIINSRWINSLLIANRGEIACRIIKTARKLNIQTIAVYSEADRHAVHTRFADQAFSLGNASDAQSTYLNISALQKAIVESGADGVHPGYGFLSENYKFAQCVEDLGVKFVGPASVSMSLMGDKIRSKEIAANAGVPTIPGSDGPVATVEAAITVASKIGYPIMMKASAGGGGRGLRIAHNEKEITQQFQVAVDEAQSSFGDGRLLIEKYLTSPRHIEIQVLGDKHGNVYYFPERECSVQRRHQKVVEESPCVVINEDTRRQMGQQALALCKEVGYYSAGTLEFMLDQDNKSFYFLEMNTRLQVEHPVSEFVTGVDLVEQMIRIADGQELQLQQSQLNQPNGWSFQARVCAEDPAKGFSPQIGTILRYVEPDTNDKVRIDSGIMEGSKISMYYDALVSKIITHGEDRQQALQTMHQALEQCLIKGVTNNLSFLRTMMAHEQFKNGQINTSFLNNYFPDNRSCDPINFQLSELQSNQLTAFSVYYYFERLCRFNPDLTAGEYSVQFDSVQQTVSIKRSSSEATICEIADSDGQSFELIISQVQHKAKQKGIFRVNINSSPLIFQILSKQDRSMTIQFEGAHRIVLVQPLICAQFEKYMPKITHEYKEKFVFSPMSGMLVKLFVEEGQEVVQGDQIAIVEAMKMQNVVTSPKDGIIKMVQCQQGSSIQTQQVICSFE